MTPNVRPRTLLFVAPWEGSRAIARMPAEPTARVSVCFVESLEIGARLPWQRQKLVLVLSAMRHFADELRDAGHVVDYRRADDYATGLLAAAHEHGTARVASRNPVKSSSLVSRPALRRSRPPPNHPPTTPARRTAHARPGS